jgi:hypothetical protein
VLCWWSQVTKVMTYSTLFSLKEEQNHLRRERERKVVTRVTFVTSV